MQISFTEKNIWVTCIHSISFDKYNFSKIPTFAYRSEEQKCDRPVETDIQFIMISGIFEKPDSLIFSKFYKMD